MPAQLIGIDALSFAGPDAYLALRDLATARGVDPAKFTVGLGQHGMAIASPCEDPVTMAVAAGRKALSGFDIDPEQIGTLIVGTETGIDHSKPVAVYAHELLGLSQHCRTFETKHACYGAMAGLTASMDWIGCGRARGRKALVIASDIASYGLNTPGEPTQGAGAVAMVVSDAPRLLTIDPDYIGDYTRQVMDFWRPLYSKYAVADGHYSIECYLDALVGALNDATSQHDHAQACPDPVACLYHIPFVRMAFKAHQRYVEHCSGQALNADHASGWQSLNDDYAQRVRPWLSLNAQIGNIYTGSLFLSLIDLLRQQAASMAGQPISLFSYGSGCGATYCIGRVADAAGQWTAQLDPADDLKRRRRLSIDEYEHLIEQNQTADQQTSLTPEEFGHRQGLYYVGTRDHQRQYRALG
ncbi:MAG: hydroxymethylglutaryl-CoA synthase [Pseudomonadota bacterium]